MKKIFAIALVLMMVLTSAAFAESVTFKILSMLYGAAMLVDGGYESADRAADNLRSVLTAEL
jgi:hypothetical protein